MQTPVFSRPRQGCIILALPVAACSSSKPAEAARPAAAPASARSANAPAATGVNAPTKANKNYNVQFIQGVAGDEFYITMQCGIEAEAKKLGVTSTPRARRSSTRPCRSRSSTRSSPPSRTRS